MRYTTILLLAFLVSACHKKKEDPAPTYYMTAGINGVAWSATSSITRAGINLNPCVLVHGSYGGNDVGILVLIPKNPKIGVYSLPDSIASCSYSPHYAYGGSYKAISGSINITSVTSTEVKGTFDAVCPTPGFIPDTIKITNGKFYAPI